MSTMWTEFIESRAVEISLGELHESLADYIITVMPMSAVPTARAEAIMEMDEPLEQQMESMKLWIIGWNLLNNDGEPLPIPKESDRWKEELPSEVILFLARRINEIDQERMEIPTPSGSE